MAIDEEIKLFDLELNPIESTDDLYDGEQVYAQVIVPAGKEFVEWQLDDGTRPYPYPDYDEEVGMYKFTVSCMTNYWATFRRVRCDIGFSHTFDKEEE